MKSIWKLKPEPKEDEVLHLQKSLGVSPVICKLLVQRGIKTFDAAKAFFRPDFNQLHNPLLMEDMLKASKRVIQAIQQKQRVLIYGDYDVDGTTSVSMMYSFLKKYNPQIDYYIPDRYTEGYGVSSQGVNFAIDNQFDLIIILDCGIKAIEQIQYAQDNSIDCIICDHHIPGKIIPNAFAILNPKKPTCSYPFKELSGCGIGFKLIQAIIQEWNDDTYTFEQELQYTALSTAADIVPLIGENRTLMHLGIKSIQKEPLLPLLHMLGDKYSTTIVSDLVFKVAPKINAAGRIEHAHKAVEFLTNFDESSSEKLHAHISSLNSQRKEIELQTFIEAKELVDKSKPAHILQKEGWHKGVIGIVASKIIEYSYKPALILTKVDTYYTGSARSVSGFNIHAALEYCSEYIDQFGGHAFAAGVKIHESKYADFKKLFYQYCEKNLLASQKQPEIKIDHCLQLNDITPSFYSLLDQLKPFGPANPSPVFLFKNIQPLHYSKVVGANNNHLKLSVTNNDGIKLDGICFNIEEEKSKKIIQSNSIDAVGKLIINTFLNNNKLEIEYKDIVIVK